MPDIFTDGAFVELPSDSIFDDCTEWLPVLEAGFEWLVQTNRIANATDDEIETARINIMDWLGSIDCTGC